MSGIVNATSMAIGPGRAAVRLESIRRRCLSSDEPTASTSSWCRSWEWRADWLSIAKDGLYVGDRSGTIFRVRDNRAEPFATLPASVAAFHLAISPEGELFASGPTLSTYDHVYRIGPDGKVRSVLATFGRPQGLAFSPSEGIFTWWMRLPAEAGCTG